MRPFAEYQSQYPNARMTRSDDGVLEVVLQSPDGGPLRWSERAHRELPSAFADIGADPGNRVMILTGAGDQFCPDLDLGSLEAMEPSAMWEKIYWEGKRLVENLLNIDVPIIAAVNGPARVHAELAVLSDIVLATHTTVFQDPHVNGGVVCGDGAQVIWPLLIGINRARYFLLLGSEIDAEEALRLGVVNELLPADDLLPRARELAHRLAEKPTLTLRYSRVALTQRLKRQMLDDLGYGLMMESRGAIAHRAPSTLPWVGDEHL